jgi:radical SAM superfamily enzyme YgiQ (UPF0313 family)
MSYQLTQTVKKLLADEQGTIYKPHGDRLQIALAFPNSYRVGMSNLGYQLVYRLFNSREDTVCERTFLPEPLEEIEYRKSHTALFSWESQRAIDEFDVVAFSCSFEMDYLNVLKMLELAGLPLLAAERDERFPLVIMGGPAPWVNPEPIAPFIDAFVIGEAEGLTDQLVPLIRSHLEGGRWRKPHLLRALADLPGLYIPSLYDVSYHDDGTVAAVEPQDGAPEMVRRWVTRDLHRYNTAAQIVTPNTEFSNMFLVEAARGCGQGCRFCFAGYGYRPVRYTPPERLTENVATAPPTDAPIKVGLVGSSLTDHKQIAPITSGLAEKGHPVALASLRADNLSESVACAIGQAGQKTVTLAPETGSYRLRLIARKHVTDEDVVVAAERCAAVGVQQIKLYYIIGLPCERDEDLLAIADLSSRVQKAGNFRKVTLTMHPFVPKPHTAYQWAGAPPPPDMERRLKMAGQAVRKANSRLDFTVDSVRNSFIQGILSTGDRRVSALLLEAHRNGGNWRAALRDSGLDGEFYTCRPRPFEERLPWEHIFLGVKKDYLWREWQRALDLNRSLDEAAVDSGPATEDEAGELVGARSVETLRWG